MIKYVELTPPEQSAFRQAKILSIECKEGGQISEGDVLFRVKSGQQEIDLPSTRAGRIVELIVDVEQNITLSTALLLLETEVTSSTASKSLTDDKKPLADDERRKTKKSKKPSKKASKKKAAQATQKKPKKSGNKKHGSKTKIVEKHEQQSLDLLGDVSEQIASAPPVKTPKEITKKSNSMSVNSIQKITIPDIGTDEAKVIEILVNVGDSVAQEDPLLTLESDKASMELPSTHAGVVSSIAVEVDQDVSEGMVVIELSVEELDESDEGVIVADIKAPAPSATPEPPMQAAEVDAPSGTAELVSVVIPDIGGDTAKVIEILVEVGQTVAIEDALVTLESDKASMDVPSSAAGTIETIDVEMDQEVGQGTLVLTLLSDNAEAAKTLPSEMHAADMSAGTSSSEPAQSATNDTAPPPTTATTKTKPTAAVANAGSQAAKSHASPSVRRFARELGADLTKVTGTGRKGRISKDDVKAFVKGVLSSDTPKASAKPTGGAGIPEVPAQDFTKFGEIDIQPLNRIKRITATNLHRSWLNVPHVTHSDESNISDLEIFRKQLNAENANAENYTKLSPLAFIVKAVVRGLQTYPQFNSSLEPGGENLIYKKYINIGIAVETPDGLVVPVVKDADKKSVGQIAQEMGELAAKARNKKLTLNDMSGACFTISSLGGIGGTHFTPIVNAPEVAILAVSRAKVQPLWDGEEFVPATMLPISLSYDHRVIDGAEAARFTRHVAAVLEDVRRLTI